MAEKQILSLKPAPRLEQVGDEHSELSLIHISEPTRQKLISYAVFCLKKAAERVPRSPCNGLAGFANTKRPSKWLHRSVRAFVVPNLDLSMNHR